MLLQSGHAYRCFCTAERLDALAKLQNSHGMGSGYDRTCAHLSSEESDDRASRGEAHVIRLKAPEHAPLMKDLIYKKIQFKSLASADKGLFDDTILIKSDGFPTYHLANVVDDHHMKITHVIRATVSLCYSTCLGNMPLNLIGMVAFNPKAPSIVSGV